MSRLSHFKRNVGTFRMWQQLVVYGFVAVAAVGYALVRRSPWPVLLFVAATAIPYATRRWLVDHLQATIRALSVVGPLIMIAGLVAILVPHRLPLAPTTWTHGLLVAIPAYLAAFFFVLSDPLVRLRR